MKSVGPLKSVGAGFNCKWLYEQLRMKKETFVELFAQQRQDCHLWAPLPLSRLRFHVRVDWREKNASNHLHVVTASIDGRQEDTNSRFIVRQNLSTVTHVQLTNVRHVWSVTPGHLAHVDALAWKVSDLNLRRSLWIKSKRRTPGANFNLSFKNLPKIRYKAQVCQ